MWTVYWGSNVVIKLARAIFYTFVWMAFCFCMHQDGGTRWELVWFLSCSIGCACERSLSIQMSKLEVVTHADALIQEHPTGLWWQRVAAAMLGGIGWSMGNSFPYSESKKCCKAYSGGHFDREFASTAAALLRRVVPGLRWRRFVDNVKMLRMMTSGNSDLLQEIRKFHDVHA